MNGVVAVTFPEQNAEKEGPVSLCSPFKTPRKATQTTNMRTHTQTSSPLKSGSKHFPLEGLVSRCQG